TSEPRLHPLPEPPPAARSEESEDRGAHAAARTSEREYREHPHPAKSAPLPPCKSSNPSLPKPPDSRPREDRTRRAQNVLPAEASAEASHEKSKASSSAPDS